MNASIGSYYEYCIGCGLCGSINGANMIANKRGFLHPDVISSEFVRKICPINQTVSENSSIEDIWGKSLEIDLGYAKDVEVRKKASSGGVLTALAEYLLNYNIVDGVIHTGTHKYNPLKTATFCSRTAEDVRKRIGSRYGISSPLSDFLKYVKDNERYAFIGKPCDVQALRNLQKYDTKYRKMFPYLLTFLCAGMPSDMANRELVETMGCEVDNLSFINYRGNGWPGSASAQDKEGNIYQLDYANAWGKILGRDKNKFCRLCMYGFGEAADIACGDAWYIKNNEPDFSEHEGRNVIFVRNKKGKDLLEDACLENYIEYKPYKNYMNEIKITQSYQYQRKSMVEPQIRALMLFHKKVPPYSLKVLRTYRRKDINFKKIFFGTIKRIMKRTY